MQLFRLCFGCFFCLGCFPNCCGDGSLLKNNNSHFFNNEKLALSSFFDFQLVASAGHVPKRSGKYGKGWERLEKA